MRPHSRPTSAPANRSSRRSPRLLAAIGATAALALAAACGTETTPTSDASQPVSSGVTASAITVITHDSFALPAELLAQFTAETGITVNLAAQGDAGGLANTLVLSAGNPSGDVAFGIDNSFAGRTLDAGVFAPYVSPEAGNGSSTYSVPGADALTAIDLGDVCVNADLEYFASRNLPLPTGYADLTRPEYRGMLVTEDAEKSTPGAAFLLGTIAEYGDGWPDYWKALRANDLSIADGWTTAYSTDFSGSSGRGPKPLVVSYASSPAAEIGADGRARTQSINGTCYRQVEHAGILAGSKHETEAGKFIDFLLAEPVQAALPEAMYTYPVRTGVALPESWASAAPLPDNPHTLPAKDIADNLTEWLRTWHSIALG